MNYIHLTRHLPPVISINELSPSLRVVDFWGTDPSILRFPRLELWAHFTLQSCRSENGVNVFFPPHDSLSSSPDAKVMSSFQENQPPGLNYSNSNISQQIFYFQERNSKCNHQITAEWLNNFAARSMGYLDCSSRHRGFRHLVNWTSLLASKVWKWVSFFFHLFLV